MSTAYWMGQLMFYGLVAGGIYLAAKKIYGKLKEKKGGNS